jgi:two-component system OmpR family sensor kinase
MGENGENMSEKLQWSERMREKERLLGLLIHDLNGPLSIVSTSVANLLRKTDRYGPLTDKQRHIIERISRNIQRAKSLLQEMIEISRSEEGLFLKELFLIEKTLRDSVLDVLEITTPHMAAKLSRVENDEKFKQTLKVQGIYLELCGKYSILPFCHDQKKIRQILRNLVSNALKHRRKRIDVSISGETDLLISVEDDGLGIPVGEQENIFEPFVRLNDKKRTNVPGLGLGLTGVKALVEAMGGKIALVSGEGLGTRFTVQIPPL